MLKLQKCATGDNSEFKRSDEASTRVSPWPEATTAKQSASATICNLIMTVSALDLAVRAATVDGDADFDGGRNILSTEQ